MLRLYYFRSAQVRQSVYVLGSRVLAERPLVILKTRQRCPGHYHEHDDAVKRQTRDNLYHDDLLIVPVPLSLRTSGQHVIVDAAGITCRGSRLTICCSEERT
jgi:hypothetical protein